MKTPRLIILLLSGFVVGACQAHPPKKVIVVDQHPKHRDYVIVYQKPAKHRVCSKHHRHWHCRKIKR